MSSSDKRLKAFLRSKASRDEKLRAVYISNLRDACIGIPEDHLLSDLLAKIADIMIAMLLARLELDDDTEAQAEFRLAIVEGVTRAGVRMSELETTPIELEQHCRNLMDAIDSGFRSFKVVPAPEGFE